MTDTAKRMYVSEQVLTTRIQVEAIEAGWPVDVARSLTCEIREDGWVDVRYPQERANDVYDYEFGAVGSPSRSVIRKFLTRVDRHAGQVLMAETLDRLGGF